ncbi:hypothetical protein ACFQQB_45505 [Nonomuraea rubra]|uniref:hypothetical protein n=1 Tax=Nonomuraea rubra TaxID=46180 RepID=UPI003614EE0C
MEAELEHACALLALDEDLHVRRKITELMLAVLKDTKTLPPVEEVRRKVRTHQDLNPTVTVAEWMAEFLRRKRKIDQTTRRSYEAHIRLYFTPTWVTSGWTGCGCPTSRACLTRSRSSTMSSSLLAPVTIRTSGRRCGTGGQSDRAPCTASARPCGTR